VKDLLQTAVTARAEQRPDAVAVSLGEEHLTYGALEAESNRLARLLRAGGLARGDRVALLLPKSPAAVIAILAVLKADAIYVPLDLSSPASRVAKMIAACGSRWILAGEAAVPLLDELFREPDFAAAHAVGWLSGSAQSAQRFAPEFGWDDLAAFSAGACGSHNGPGDAAHILFTSGSTGVPKGVVITHGNVLAFVRWARDYFATSASDRISWHPPLHFDLSTFDVFCTLSAGARLHPVPPELGLLPHKLADFIRREALTQWFSVPSVLNYMTKFDVVRQRDFPALRRVLWCGEVLPTPTLIYWMQRLPHATFTNLYGPTETTIASSYYTVPRCPVDERSEIPIGRACPGEGLLVLGERLQPVGRGEVGDLYISGVGLSPGYWGDDAKTRSAFVPKPGATAGERMYRTGDLAKIGADDLVYFVGRADSQIKSRGYRIELGEIEAALHSLPGLQECAVVGIASDGFEGTAIGCAYVPQAAQVVSPASLRLALGRLVPSYMVPSRWLACDALPKNPNGKIDRPRLRELFSIESAARGDAALIETGKHWEAT
jgi:amino acid adenylation domain-containing protein